MALSAERRIRREKWLYRSYTLALGKKGWKGGLAVYDQSAAKVIPCETGASQTDLFALGVFAETVDAAGGDKAVVIEHFEEVSVIWFANDTNDAVTANDIGKDIYGVDDFTVSNSSASSTRSVVGVARAIDTTLGVAVERKK